MFKVNDHESFCGFFFIFIIKDECYGFNTVFALFEFDQRLRGVISKTEARSL